MVKQTIDLCGDERRVSQRGSGGTIDVHFDELVAIDNGAYIMVSSVFQSQTCDLQGSTSNRFVPIYEEEHERRLAEYKDCEHSPLAHIYDNVDTDMGWDEWIEAELRHEEYELLYDQSYVHSVEDQLNDAHFERHGDEPMLWECVGGGRMSRMGEYDEVLRADVLHLAHSIEEGGEWVFDAVKIAD